MEHISISITTNKNRTQPVNLLQTCRSNNFPATRQQTATISNKVANILGKLTIVEKRTKRYWTGWSCLMRNHLPGQLSPMCYQLG